MEVTTTLPAEPRSVADARRFATSAVERWGVAGVRDKVELVVSELATNAVLHARTPLTVRVTREGLDVLVEVYDASPAPPQLRRFGLESATGRGLRLVASLSASWGVESTPDGKRIWCRLLADAAGGMGDDSTLAAFASFDVDAIADL